MMHLRSIGRWIVPALFAAAAASTGIHAATSTGNALSHPTTRAWLIVFYGVLRTGVALAFAVFTIGRAAPWRPSRSPVAFLACAVAIASVLAFKPPAPGIAPGLVVAGELLTVAFCLWLLVSVSFLGRCFGVLPEARGLVTSGPYRLIRHPVYLGEIGACVGLAIAAPSPVSAGALAALVIAQLVRMRLEERALTRAFPEYERYAARTPRLLPRLALSSGRPTAGSTDALAHQRSQ
jgi:protein-S-isoprenylcysteine O-methyltransferase Ste14